MTAAAAGFCQVSIGDIEVTFVPDGFGTSNPREWFFGGSEEVWDENPQLLNDDGQLVMSLGALLVRSAGKLALVDLGWGIPDEVGPTPAQPPEFPSQRGLLIENLRRLGIGPEEIDIVLFSHLHGDHVGWLVDPATKTSGDPSLAAPTFVNADHYLSEPEWAYWSEQAALDGSRSLSPEQQAVLGSRLRFVADGESVLPGVEVVESFGHTPGHLSYLIASGRERALVLGDAIHCPVEMLEPEMSFAIDVDPELAKKTRAHLAQSLLDSETLAVAPHFADLVFGRLLKSEGRPTWSFPDSQVLTVPS